MQLTHKNMTPETFAVNFKKDGDLTKKNSAGQVYYDMFLKLAHEAETSKDKLNKNYKHISKTWKDYECFTVVYAPTWPATHWCQEYEAVAFSALQTDHFGDKIGRALTRTYYSKSERQGTLAPRRLPNLASRYMLPKQYEYAKEKNFDHIFISFESTLVRKKFTTLFTKMLNKTYKDQNWKELDYLYYTCKIDGMINESCWQHIVLNSFNDTPFLLHRKTYD